MNVRRVVAASVAPQPWRNGGGCTRELLAWPSPVDWSLRISLADIEADGPFSVFPGITRWFAVLEGAGVTLSFDGREHRLRRGAAPLCFDGARAPDCRLIDGPTRDLNLMLRAGDGTMRAVQRGIGWDETFLVRGLYAEAAGRWSAGSESRDVDASTLLWSDGRLADAATWYFSGATTAAAPAWWFGFTPATADA